MNIFPFMYSCPINNLLNCQLYHQSCISIFLRILHTQTHKYTRTQNDTHKLPYPLQTNTDTRTTTAKYVKCQSGPHQNRTGIKGRSGNTRLWSAALAGVRFLDSTTNSCDMGDTRKGGGGVTAIGLLNSCFVLRFQGEICTKK